MIEKKMECFSLSAVILSLSLFSSFAHGEFSNELFFGIGGERDFQLEEKGSPNYEHDSNQKFLDGTTFLAGYRGGYNFGVTLGLSAQVGWMGHSPIRKESGQTNASGSKYRFETNYILLGPMIIVPLGSWFRLIGEYYPLNRTWVTYSDEKSINPFRKGDTFTGNGFAVGGGLVGKSATLSLLYRAREFDKMEANGVEHDLPNSSYGTFRISEIVLQLGFLF